MNKIEHAEYRGGLIKIIHEGDQDDNYNIELCRGGLLWPAEESPGYLCILGQRPKYNKARRKPLVLLAEHQVDLPKQMIEAIAEEVRRLLCRSFYVDYNERNLNYQDTLEQYLKRFNYGKVDVSPPYLKDWITGCLSIDQWGTDGALKIPEGSILREQIENHTFEDRKESRRGPFYAMDALRCVLGSFEQEPARPVVIKQSGYAWV